MSKLKSILGMWGSIGGMYDFCMEEMFKTPEEKYNENIEAIKKDQELLADVKYAIKHRDEYTPERKEEIRKVLYEVLADTREGAWSWDTLEKLQLQLKKQLEGQIKLRGVMIKLDKMQLEAQNG